VAISKKSVTSGTNTGTTATVSVTTSETPSATAVGDLVVVFHLNDFYTTTTMGTPTATGSPTLTAITGGSADGGSNLGHINGWWYVANTAGAQTITVTETGAHDEEKGLIAYVLGGANTTTPIDNATNASGVSSTSDVAPSASPATADAFVIALTCSGGGAFSTGYTTPAPLTEDIDFTVGGLSAAAGSAQLSASGATGTYTFTASTSIPWSAVTVTLRTGTAVAAPIVRPVVFVPPAPFGTPWRGPRIKPFQLLGDASSSPLTSVTLADTGTGDDALTVTATAALTDVGAGTDALSAAAAVPLADVGTGTDTVTVTAAVPLADVGAGSDAVTVAAAAALADVGTGTDALAATVAVPLTETGAGADTIATAAAVPLDDTATGTDAIAAPAAVPLADTATGADALTVTATVAVTDAAPAPTRSPWRVGRIRTRPARRSRGCSSPRTTQHSRCRGRRRSAATSPSTSRTPAQAPTHSRLLLLRHWPTQAPAPMPCPWLSQSPSPTPVRASMPWVSPVRRAHHLPDTATVTDALASMSQCRRRSRTRAPAQMRWPSVSTSP
jgi:hypothetical protein